MATLFFLPYLIVSPHNFLIQSLHYQGGESDAKTSAFEKVTILSDSNRLVANYLEGGDNSRAIIILLHGISGSKERWSSVQSYLKSQNISTLAIDLRAHGESDGKYTTFGIKESEDLHNWINWIQEQESFDSLTIGVMGHSLGAATSIISLSRDKRIDFGIIVSSFSNLEDTFQDYSRHFIGFNIPLITRYLLKRSGKIADFSPSDVKPVKFCEMINQPIYFAHGIEDEKIMIHYGFENFKSVPHNKKEFHPIPGANHDNVVEIGDTFLLSNVISFLEADNSLRMP